MLVTALEHFKCDELTRAPCQSQPNFDVFNHFSMIKVAETFCGCGHPPSSAPFCMLFPLQTQLARKSSKKILIFCRESYHNGSCISAETTVEPFLGSSHSFCYGCQSPFLASKKQWLRWVWFHSAALKWSQITCIVQLVKAMITTIAEFYSSFLYSTCLLCLPFSCLLFLCASWCSYDLCSENKHITVEPAYIGTLRPRESCCYRRGASETEAILILSQNIQYYIQPFGYSWWWLMTALVSWLMPTQAHQVGGGPQNPWQ